MDYSLSPILVSTFIITIGGTATLKAQEKEEKPNVILIMCDDLGWGDVGFNGNKVIKTPYLDKMAASGIKLNRFYTASAVSSPTRASCLTGRNPFRMGVFSANEGILRPEEITLPELLKEEGYSTGHFGKWHLGTLTYTEKDANRGRKGNLREYNPPKAHSYDEAFVTESKVPTWDPMIAPPKNKRTSDGWNYLKEGEKSQIYGTYFWDIEGKKVTDNLEGDDSRIIMDRVLPFIDNNKENPFLAVIWLHTPHKPCVAGPEYAKMYSEYSNEFMNYAGCITAMDYQIGRLQKYLEEKKLDKNTMIWFCSDNGPENCKPNGGGVTGGFKERKRSLYEGGVRVPAFVVWPNVIDSAFKSDIPTTTNDYLPTIASAVGVNKNKLTNKLDGVDLMPLLKGRMKHRTKPIVTSYGGQISCTDNTYKVYVKENKVELYNIVEDPYEENPINNPKKLKKYIKHMDNVMESYKESFEGVEYGRVSYDKMQQIWPKNIPVLNQEDF